MKSLRSVPLLLLLVAPLAEARADQYDATVDIFENAVESESFFDDCYAYAVFPKIGKGGMGVGGARGRGRVYVDGEHVGNTKMTQLTVGLQLGGQAFRQRSAGILTQPTYDIFDVDHRVIDQCTDGNGHAA